MLRIVLTGGIGSGKSTVSRMFAELGATLVDADEIAKEITAKGTPAYLAIQQRFGADFFDTSGKINRKQLRQRIFSDPKARQWLESLLHPIIIAEMKRLVGTIDTPYVIIEIPLITKTPTRDWIDRVLVIDAKRELQIQRVKERDEYPEEEIEKILNSQISSEERLLLADDVIKNDGNMEKLKEQVKALHEKYLGMCEAK